MSTPWMQGTLMGCFLLCAIASAMVAEAADPPVATVRAHARPSHESLAGRSQVAPTSRSLEAGDEARRQDCDGDRPAAGPLHTLLSRIMGQSPTDQLKLCVTAPEEETADSQGHEPTR